MQNADQVRRDLRRQLGREPEVQEIARVLYPQAEMRTEKLEAPIEDQHLPEPTSLFEQKLEAILQTLEPRERAILQLRFGLKDRNPRTLQEVAEHFTVSHEEIRQIEAKALSKLRHPTRSRWT